MSTHITAATGGTAASKYEQTLGEAPASVSVLTSADIERYGWRTLAEALQTVRGMYVSDDRNFVYLGARGFGRPTDYNNRVLLLINGHTRNEDFYGASYLGPTLGLTLDVVERIEVVRGPGSAPYGTGAIFAVIDVVTKDGGAIDGLRVSAEGGSFGRKGVSGVYGEELGDDAELTVSGLWRDIDGQDLYYEEYDQPESNDGIAEGLNWDRGGGVQGSLRAGDFTAHGLFSSRKSGIPTGAFEIAFNDALASTLDEAGFIEARYATEPTPRTGVMARGYFDHYHSFGSYPYDEFADFFEENTGQWGGAEVQFRWDPREYDRLVVGVEAQRHFTVDYDVWDADDVTYIDLSLPFTLLSAYAENTYQPLRNLSLTLGVRGDSSSTDDDSMSPRAAVIYRPFQSSTLKLLYGEAFRAPTRYERFYEDPDFHKTNPALEPESVHTFEAVWDQRISSDLQGVVSAYRYTMSKLIDETVDPADDLGVFENVGDVDALGIEAELRAHLGGQGRAYASYAYQSAESVGSGIRLTNSPAHLARAGIVVPVIAKVFAAAELIAECGRRTVQDTETDAFALLNLNLSTTELFGGARAALLVRNVLDEEYAYPGGFEHLQAAILQNGRDVALTIEHRF
ncbi:TonB-dependent receptor [Candidatus Poribacteria bacterium]|nr:TonB-dependent receptor [Candidatus Poribacteria bacterium]MBT5533829.1 TonB-dependent receptor [Candidatus Poribacteria bacterium]MBT5710447.1 TonB-dependent receptor [Candidatus Poribacteria bacterium]MBT7097357.1 TonB-dependent receptor [Candidatus Poribacteria bacterium]MBT7807428.1 TonB-dependent receptor [Candidatus Poribacteria bacterium]